MVHRDPDPVDEIDPDPDDEESQDPQSFGKLTLDRISEARNRLLREEEDSDDDPDEEDPSQLSFGLADHPAALDAWLQVSRLMSQLEEAFTWLSEIEGGARQVSEKSAASRIRRGSRQLIRCFDAIALAMPAIAVQVATSMTSGSFEEYDRYVHQWYERMRLHRKRHARRSRR